MLTRLKELYSTKLRCQYLLLLCVGGPIWLIKFSADILNMLVYLSFFLIQIYKLVRIKIIREVIYCNYSLRYIYIFQHGEPGAAVADLQPVDVVVAHVLMQILSAVCFRLSVDVMV